MHRVFGTAIKRAFITAMKRVFITAMKRVFITEYVGLATRLEALAMAFLIAEYFGHKVCIDWHELDALNIVGAEHRARIDLTHGFEYSLAEIGRGWTKTSQPIKFELADSYGQFAEIHLCQSGIVH